MLVKHSLVAAAGISGVLAGPLNFNAPKRNKVNLVLPRGATTSHPLEISTTGAEDAISLGFPTDWPVSFLTAPMPPMATLTPPAKARAVTAMVGTSSHSNPPPDTTATVPSTAPSNTGLPPCMQDGTVVPPKPLLEPWCSSANKRFNCQFCSHTLVSLPPAGDSLDKALTEQDFELWTANGTAGDITRVVKEDRRIGTGDRPVTDPCCINGGVPQYDCDNCRSDGNPPSTPSHGADPSPVSASNAILGRDQNDLCFWTKGLQTFNCYPSNEDPPADVPGEVCVWVRTQAAGGDTYKYEKLDDGATDANSDSRTELCCGFIGLLPMCFQCPSTTSATATSPPAATANQIAAQGANDVCCFTNVRQIFNCRLCTESVSKNANNGTGEVSVWKQGRSVGHDVFEYEKAEDTDIVASRDSAKKCCTMSSRQDPVCYECPVVANPGPNRPPRQAPTTTKATATVTKPTPTLSFPDTLTNLPQITPSVIAIEMRTEQKKCCNHYGVVISCHNCSPDEEHEFEDAITGPNTSEECCVRLDAELICHHCPAGLSDMIEREVAIPFRSVAPRQQTYDYHMVCNGIYDMAGANMLKCAKGKDTLNGGICQSACHCDGLGSMHCDAMAGSGCSNDQTTVFCRLGSAYWGCACTHLPDHPHALDNTMPVHA